MKNNMRCLLLIGICMLVPAPALAAVRISEIAWMGVGGANGQYGEWLELYNDSTASVDLSGWKLYTDGGGQLLYTLSKTIPAGGYFLIERTTTSMPDPVPRITDEQGTFGGGGLSNSGEDLVLKDSTGAVVQSITAASGWPAGDATTKQTMQWNGTSWITAAATPKAPTAGIIANAGSTGTIGTATSSESGNGSSTSRVVLKSAAPKKQKDYEPHIELTIPHLLTAHVPQFFDAAVYTKHDLNPPQGMYRWSFGDGSTAVSYKKYMPALHTYAYPGTYTLLLEYFDSPLDLYPLLSITAALTVHLPDLTVSVLNGGALSITNNTAVPVDLSKWTVFSEGYLTELPSITMLGAHAAIVIPSATLRIPLATTVQLRMPDGTPVQTAAPAP